MNADDLNRIYNRLSNQYPLTFTNTFSLDDGFTEDMPIIVGRNATSTFWLYEHGGDLVFSVEVPDHPYHDHWHPQSVEEAVQTVIDFIESK